MSAPSASTASTSAPPTSPTILLFARGVWSLFHLWPALRLAVAEQWGGDDSAEKRVWFISTIVDEFEDKAALSTSTASSTPSASTGLIPPPTGLDLDSLADILYDIILEEFSIDLEDDSPVMIAKRLLQLWSDASRGLEAEVVKLEEEEGRMGKKKVVASKGADAEEDDGSDIEEEAAAPALVERRAEPEVDDDGFTMVKKGKKGGR
ncbi:Pre-rRNA-processing protein TSR2-domain-containing protein [Mrakia frigida]|uniref:Pre-rRNA-processing protein TSR2-domain-containing protein n=1 Tax=Mrakia frigida TaxID=29902 RepID=UPI003FCC1665